MVVYRIQATGRVVGALTKGILQTTSSTHVFRSHKKSRIDDRFGSPYLYSVPRLCSNATFSFGESSLKIRGFHLYPFAPPHEIQPVVVPKLTVERHADQPPVSVHVRFPLPFLNRPANQRRTFHFPDTQVAKKREQSFLIRFPLAQSLYRLNPSFHRITSGSAAQREAGHLRTAVSILLLTGLPQEDNYKFVCCQCLGGFNPSFHRITSGSCLTRLCRQWAWFIVSILLFTGLPQEAGARSACTGYIC
ncbi:hypothetical protein CLV58_10326 [Spirosoma oryzae]|uniref:Uncharacterized protein n=1 Tax=Spirosoma oryzae TaxID=1469603 RepID=A0A2T0TEG5_9BACT|nr:hypothetical protein CLV58_10326 [Spirosoma oryzae]